MFGYVFDSSDNPTMHLILQIKNEAWNGESLDVKGEIPDETVIRDVMMKWVGSANVILAEAN